MDNEDSLNLTIGEDEEKLLHGDVYILIAVAPGIVISSYDFYFQEEKEPASGATKSSKAEEGKDAKAVENIKQEAPSSNGDKTTE